MPYIKSKERRIELNQAVHMLLLLLAKFGIRGNFNYFLFKLAKEMCFSYSDYADFRSELMEAHDEIGRRLLAPYENEKIIENGDVE